MENRQKNIQKTGLQHPTGTGGLRLQVNPSGKPPFEINYLDALTFVVTAEVHDLIFYQYRTTIINDYKCW